MAEYADLLRFLDAQRSCRSRTVIEASFRSIAERLASMHPEIRELPDPLARLDAARRVMFGAEADAPVCTEDGCQVSMHSCPLVSTALEFRELCAVARAVLSALTGDEVEQSEWIIRGDPRCTFEIRAVVGQG
jgi:predicted ArsR family transcriptional regulator